MESMVSLSERIILCPSCLVAVQGGVCPECGRSVDVGDWPSIPGGKGLSPCSSKNLDAPVDGDPHYRVRLSEATEAQGSLCTDLPYEFEHGNFVIRIGSSRLDSEVQIDGASPLHAVLIRNKRTEDWWIYDCGSRSGTFVNFDKNQAPVHCQKLLDGDVIKVAGVKLVFRNTGDGCLESGAKLVKGMSLLVDDLCFEIRRKKGTPRKILDHVSFSVSPGELIGVLGPSGCGKSSLVQRIIGLAKPDSGEIYVNGHLREEKRDEFRAATAYLPQNVEKTLHDDLTLDEEIDCFRRIHLPPSEDEEQENEACLKTLGLSGKGDSRIRSLSGGEKRRVGIALALLRRPQMLLLDEPCAGLDPASEGVLMRHLRGIANQGRTVLCVTHVLSNLEQFDKLLVLSKGQIAYYGKPTELLGKFGARDFGDLYQKLEAGADSQYDSPDHKDLTQTDLPKVARPSFLRRITGYLTRSYRELFVIKDTSSREGFVAAIANACSVLFSSSAVLFFWQPFLLAVGIRLACACALVAHNSVDMDLLGFCAALAMFWVGINNAAREFVKERVPGRCLENLNRVPLVPYLLSKFAWTFMTCFAQTFAFTVLLGLSSFVPLRLEDGETSRLAMSLLWFLPLYACCLMGAFCGLSVSAITKKEMSAVSFVPNIAIFALLFSDAMIRFGEDQSDLYVKAARGIAEYVVPCYRASEVLADIQGWSAPLPKGAVAKTVLEQLSLLGEHLQPLVIMFIVYMVVSFAVIWFFQRRNEKAWDGR